ncbi:MAG: hypothetical protein KF760_19465 [Candidatus Eremiobacteraeota bacterium]|nr:hypothetical protein [Candidatus Eremiobacteraeota bacterium]MCW5868749.1 hypothetical protein [Candidatus Eremiobacteraeota bacterium]
MTKTAITLCTTFSYHGQQTGCSSQIAMTLQIPDITGHTTNGCVLNLEVGVPG